MSEDKPKRRRGGKLVQPGQVLNPYGVLGKDPELRKLKLLTSEELKEIGSHVLHKKQSELEKIAENPDSSTLAAWAAAVALRSIKSGDAERFDILLNRLIGKPKESVELTGKDGENLFKPFTDMVADVARRKNARRLPDGS